MENLEFLNWSYCFYIKEKQGSNKKIIESNITGDIRFSHDTVTA